MKRKLIWALRSGIILVIVYAGMAVGFVMNYCGWRPRYIKYEGFAFRYNDLEILRENKDPMIVFIDKSERMKRRYDRTHYCIATFYVRRDNISNAVEFGLWPFGIRSYYGYVHPPGD